MLSLVKKNLVGIDIGSDSIKAIRLKGITGSEISTIILEKIGCENHEDELLDGLIQMGLQTIVKRYGLSNCPSASIITDPSVSLVNVQLPPMPTDELRQAVRFEAKKEITYPISDAVIDYVIKDKPTTDNPEYTITTITVLKDAVEKHIDILKEAGLKPVSVETGLFPLMAAYDFNYSWEPSKKVGLLDIGTSKSHLLIVRDKSIRFYRDLPVGGGTFTDFFAKLYDLPYAEADEKKINLIGSGAYEDSEPPEILNDDNMKYVFEQLALELQRSFDYYQAHYREGPINELILSGGGALLQGIDEHLNEVLGMEVTIDNPFKKMYFSNKIDEERYNKTAPLFTIALGLALRKV